jgi:peptidoglycan-associated lipoprotein
MYHVRRNPIKEDTMPSSRLAITAALSLLAATGGCSHEQKVPTPVAPVTQAPHHPAPKVATLAPAALSPEAPKPKEDVAVFFDFDSALLKDAGQRVLQSVADALHRRDGSLEIEGNCDELGTTEYNLALGEERARAAKNYLVHLGVPANRIATVSYGSQRPKYPGHDDDARARNRRDDLIVR